MSPELDKVLSESFPNLYRERSMSMRDSCMGRGFEHADGWFVIVWQLSQKLESMILALPEDVRANCHASQVKQKFAILRYCVDGATKEMNELISQAEHASSVVCEDCGLPGSRRGGNYIVTMCDACWSAETTRRAGVGNLFTK